MKMIEQQVRTLIGEIYEAVDSEALDYEAPLTENIGLDSLSLLELVVAIEELFDITIDDEHLLLENFNSLRLITEYVKQAQEQVNA